MTRVPSLVTTRKSLVSTLLILQTSMRPSRRLVPPLETRHGQTWVRTHLPVHVLARARVVDGGDAAAIERGKLLHRLADLIEKHLHLLATMDTWDMGKPIEVTKTSDVVETFDTFR